MIESVSLWSVKVWEDFRVFGQSCYRSHRKKSHIVYIWCTCQITKNNNGWTALSCVGAELSGFIKTPADWSHESWEHELHVKVSSVICGAVSTLSPAWSITSWKSCDLLAIHLHLVYYNYFQRVWGHQLINTPKSMDFLMSHCITERHASCSVQQLQLIEARVETCVENESVAVAWLQRFIRSPVEVERTTH